MVAVEDALRSADAISKRVLPIPGYDRSDLRQEAALVAIKIAENPEATPDLVSIAVWRRFGMMIRRAMVERKKMPLYYLRETDIEGYEEIAYPRLFSGVSLSSAEWQLLNAAHAIAVSGQQPTTRTIAKSVDLPPTIVWRRMREIRKKVERAWNLDR